MFYYISFNRSAPSSLSFLNASLKASLTVSRTSVATPVVNLAISPSLPSYFATSPILFFKLEYKYGVEDIRDP